MNATRPTIIFLITTVALFVILVAVLNLWPYVIVGGSIAALIFERAMHYRNRRIWVNTDRLRVEAAYLSWRRDFLESRLNDARRTNFRPAVPRTITRKDIAEAGLRRRIKEEWDRFDGEDLR